LKKKALQEVEIPVNHTTLELTSSFWKERDVSFSRSWLKQFPQSTPTLQKDH